MSLEIMLKHLVMQYKIHPILVNFTAALVPVSLFSDLTARMSGRKSFEEVGWWTMLYAACVTPLTAAAGWLFWMKDDVGVRGMEIHKWLGTSLALLIPALAVWRAYFYRRNRRPAAAYLLIGLLLVALLAYQGSLGGAQVFNGM
ncbi:MAG TPA: DUF2231 domain-containing protein [Elusimicrobiota bacterium]|nr:DUF2231 domain-containing protein [Elusimicrobiota bacterium]